jgi:ornithine carbamoyltransferase
MKDLISVRNLSKEQIISLLDLADDLKMKKQNGIEFKPLLGKTVITSFPPTSIRTRVSFEAGIYQLGAQSINLPIEFESKDTVEDKVGHLNCWIDYLVIREPKLKLIEKIAEIAEFSVVNAMCRECHPCEILGDLQSIREIKGDLTSLKFVFVGAKGNISNTWFEAAGKLGLNLTLICPEGYETDKELFEYARSNSKGDISITNDIRDGLKNADVILTDGLPVKEDNINEFKKFIPYQVTMDMLKFADKGCIVNPCPPSTRGQEIADEVFKSENFIGYRAKENLLHMQKAILTVLERK